MRIWAWQKWDIYKLATATSMLKKTRGNDGINSYNVKKQITKTKVLIKTINRLWHGSDENGNKINNSYELSILTKGIVNINMPVI